MWNIMVNMVGWVYPLSTPPLQNVISSSNLVESNRLMDEELMKNWQWLLSTGEEIALKQDERRCSDIKKELDIIKKVTNSVKYRKHIFSEVTQYMNTLSPDMVTSLGNSRLDASKRDRIFRDIIRSVSECWLLDILMDIFIARNFQLPAMNGDISKNDNFLPHAVDVDAFIASNPEVFSSRWTEQPYKKNICGEIVSMAFYASHPTQERGLTAHLIADILWSMHVCLSREIITDLNRVLHPLEYEYLTQKILSILPNLISLWHTTTQKVGNVSDRAGRLPEKWNLDRQKEDARLASLKASGVSARYNDGPSDDLWRSHMEAVNANTTIKQSQILDSKDVFVNRRKQLENSLFFAPKVPIKKGK